MFASTLKTLQKRAGQAAAGLIKGEDGKRGSSPDEEYLDRSEILDVWSGGQAGGQAVVRYEVQNDDDGDKDGAAFMLPTSPSGVKFGTVRRSFPLPGRFIFRFKVPTPDRSFGGYAWMDISCDGETVPFFRGEICMRLLRLPQEAAEKETPALPDSLLRSTTVPLDVDFGGPSPSDSDVGSGAFDEPPEQYGRMGGDQPQQFDVQGFRPEPRYQGGSPPPQSRQPDLMESGFDPGQPAMPAAAPKPAGPPSDLMDVGGLGGLDAGGFGATPSGGAPAGGPPQPPKVFDREQLVAEREARERQRVEDANKRHLETKAAEEQMKKDKVDQGNKLSQELAAWAKTPDGTAFKDIKALLSTVDKVLWEGSGWQPVSLGDLLEPAKVKKAYRKAIIMCHPDRQQDSPADVQVRADRIFEALNAAFKNSS